jgi:hypothetical protein
VPKVLLQGRSPDRLFFVLTSQVDADLVIGAPRFDTYRLPSSGALMRSRDKTLKPPHVGVSALFFH